MAKRSQCEKKRGMLGKKFRVEMVSKVCRGRKSQTYLYEAKNIKEYESDYHNSIGNILR